MKPWLKMLGAFLLIVLIIGGIWGFNLFSFLNKMKAAGIPKQTVSSIIAKKELWQGKINALATIRSVKGADLVIEANGVVDRIYFASSQQVAAGDVIMTLRADEDRAKLEALKANATLANANNIRDKEQFAFGAISQAQMDASNAQKASTQAAVAEQSALLARKTLKAPFAGSLGIIQVSEGQYVSAGNKIVSLQALDNMFADFSLPQSQSERIKVGEKISVTTEALPGKIFSGSVLAIDSKIDTDTRSILVRATLPNPKRQLLPGMFGKVEVTEATSQSLITLPQSAIVYNPYGESVYVTTTAQSLYDQQVAKAKANGTYNELMTTLKAPENPQLQVVTQIFVTTGGRRGDQISVLSGINEGDEVVTSGQLKLKNGTAININNQYQPANNPNPTPSLVD